MNFGYAGKSTILIYIRETKQKSLRKLRSALYTSIYKFLSSMIFSLNIFSIVNKTYSSECVTEHQLCIQNSAMLEAMPPM